MVGLPYTPPESDSGLKCSMSGPTPILLRQRPVGVCNAACFLCFIQRDLFVAAFKTAVLALLIAETSKHFNEASHACRARGVIGPVIFFCQSAPPLAHVAGGIRDTESLGNSSISVCLKSDVSIDFAPLQPGLLHDCDLASVGWLHRIVSCDGA